MSPAVYRFFLAVLIAAVPTAAHATILTYTDSFTGSGTLNGTAFTNALVTISATGDTANIVKANPTTTLVAPTTVTVAGLGTDSFTDTVEVIDYVFINAGFYDVTLHTSILLTTGAIFNTYDLSTPIGPISSSSNFINIPIPTSKGSLSVTSSGFISTFQAVPAAVSPEPSSLLLCATGALGVVGSVRKRYTSHA